MALTTGEQKIKVKHISHRQINVKGKCGVDDFSMASSTLHFAKQQEGYNGCQISGMPSNLFIMQDGLPSFVCGFLFSFVFIFSKFR